METYHPDEVAFEELFFSKNITTGMAVSAARFADHMSQNTHCRNIEQTKQQTHLCFPPK